MTAVRSYLIALFLAIPLHAQTMQLSSYFGAQGTNGAQATTTVAAMATDSTGDVYMVGSTNSNLPCGTLTGVQNAFVAMVTSIDKKPKWCTFIGNSTDYGYGIALDASNNVYVVGMTNSPGLATHGAYQTTLQGTYDAFVAELNPRGHLQWFTYLGTALTSQANSVFVDSTGVYITGYTTGSGWPVAGSVSQTTYGGGGFDIAMAKLSLDGSSLLWSGYLGGGADDVGYRLAVSPDGSQACLDGYSESGDYPTTEGAFQRTKTAQLAAVVTCVNPSTGATTASTYFGGSTNSKKQCNACAAGLTFDASGNLWIVGLAQNESGFPITADALQPTYGGGLHDAFISELTTDLATNSLLYSTWFGGTGDDGAVAPEFDSSGNLWIHGNTFSQYLPLYGSPFQSANGGPNQTADAFLLELSPPDSLHSSWWGAYDTFLGGSANEFGGATQSLAVGPDVIWFGGYTESTNFPLVDAFDSELKGAEAGFVAQFCPTCGN
jgi:Beta-propeller repeat